MRPETAYRTWTFWLFTGAGVCAAGFGTGLLNVGTGWLVDRYPPRLLLAGQLVLFGAMMGLLPMVDSAVKVWVYGGVSGVSQGTKQALLGSAYAYHFGRAHHGTIRGLANTVFIGGTTIGRAVLALGPDFLSGFAPIPLVPALVGRRRGRRASRRPRAG